MEVRSLFVVLLLAMASCKPVIREPELHAGDLNLSRYMSFGDSYTAAFLDGAISIESQINAYPNIMAQQFKVVGGGDFLIPLMKTDLGCNWLPSDTSDPLSTFSKLALIRELGCNQVARLYPRLAFSSGEPLFELFPVPSPLYIGGPLYNNMAVPGMRGSDIYIEQYGNPTNIDHFNPYFWRFTSDQVNGRVISDAQRLLPTFFTAWFGLNDVLPFALAGGNRSGVDRAAITEIEGFQDNLRDFAKTLSDSGARGALATVPDITQFPFFTTINPFGLHLTSAQATDLNAQYGAYTWMKFKAGANAFVIADPHPSVQVRQLRPGELLLLSMDPDSFLCAGWGRNKPIEEVYVLDSSEISLIRQAILVFNETIKRYAAENDLALVDLELLFAEVQDKFPEDGVALSFDWLFGSFFSLDGLHPSPRGQAIIANYFIGAINAKYGASIPLADITAYRTNLFP